jgi:hypothetical protein
MCPGARQLGAGAPITVLQFAPLAWLHPMLGFYIYIACVLGSFHKGAFCRCRDNKLDGGTSRRSNFFVFRPIEVSKKPRHGFLDALKPLEQSVGQFEHCKACF